MNLIHYLCLTLVQFVVSLTSLKFRARKRAAAHTRFALPVVFNLALAMMIAASPTTNGASVGSMKECLGIRAEQSHPRTGILKNSCAISVADGELLAADSAAADSQYFISSGVRRSLASQMNGVSDIPAVIVQEGQADVQTTLNLNQLFSPKLEVPGDSRLFNIQPPIQVPIEVRPFAIPGQPFSIPLNQIKIVPP